MRLLAVAMAMLFILGTSVPMVAGSLSINLDVDGGLDAWFHGLEILASIQGDVSLVGDVPWGEGMVRFSAAGSIMGIGSYSILELMTDGWILMTASGIAADEGAISIRSLLYTSLPSLIPLQAGDLFEGVHYTVIQIGDSAAVYWGGFTGTVVGGLAPAETEGTIRLAGSGSFCLTGERSSEASSTDYPGTIPLDHPDLPESFVQDIDLFFDLIFARDPNSV